MDHVHRQKQARTIRVFRKIHRITGLTLFVFVFIMGITGTLLGWKKNSGGYLLAETQKGKYPHLDHFLPLDSISNLAVKYLKENSKRTLDTTIDRLDVRPSKGIVKVLFANHYWAMQIDGSTGALIQMERRRADFIENIHDGVILDHLFNIKGEWIKLIYNTIMGLALLLFTITGFWLWYGPKKMKV